MARMNEVRLVVSSDHQVHRTAESRPMGFEDSPEFEPAEESTHQIGRWVDDLCPTTDVSISTDMMGCHSDRVLHCISMGAR